MPNSVFHMWIAHELAKSNNFLLNDPNYYLGNIAPDAVLGRKGADNVIKNKSHLLNKRDAWESDVLNYWYQHPSKTTYVLGYVMHILTDIQFRTNCRAFEEENYIPLEERDNQLFTATAIHMRTQFQTPYDYHNMIDLVEQYTISEFGLGLTYDDMNQNINFAKRVFDIWTLPETINPSIYPLIDLTKISIQTVEYLKKVLHIERSFNESFIL